MKQHNEQQQKALKAAADSLYKAFLTMDKPGEVRQFLLDLCTPSELEAIVDRWWTASLLKQGRSYRDISEICAIENHAMRGYRNITRLISALPFQS